MAADIHGVFADADIELVRGSGGNFIVDAMGVRLWDKRRMDDAFPDNLVLIEHLRLLSSAAR